MVTMTDAPQFVLIEKIDSSDSNLRDKVLKELNDTVHMVSGVPVIYLEDNVDNSGINNGLHMMCNRGEKAPLDLLMVPVGEHK